MNTDNQPAPAQDHEALELPLDLLLHAFDALRDFEKENESAVAHNYNSQRASILALLGIGFELRRIADAVAYLENHGGY